MTISASSGPRERAKALFAAFTFAVSAPLLEKLRAEPDFFVTQRISGFMLVVFAITVSFIIPACLGVFQSWLAKVAPRLGRIFFGLLTWGLSAAFLLPYITTGRIKTVLALEYGFGLGAILAAFTVAVPAAYRFLAFLAPSALVFMGIFLTDSGIRQSVLLGDGEINFSTHKKDTTPVVLIVFDEMPLSALLDGTGQIDSQLFPSFAGLAKDSTWYRGAKAVSTHTALALPAILSGRYPSAGKKSPNFRNHPNNLFTILGTSHEPVVLERVSSLCPADICGDDKRGVASKFAELLMDSLAVYLRILLPRDRLLGIPDINTNWGGFWTKSSGPQNRDDWKRLGRIKLHQEMLDGIKPNSSKPLLLFAHHLMPHMPYQWTKELRLYPADEFPRGYVNDNWTGDEWQITQAYQRFLVQVQAADTMLGGYIKKLKDTNNWDNALVIVTADHGITFEKDTHRRGTVDSRRFQYDLMSIPLMVKYPGQSEGKVSDLIAQSVDILPTITATVANEIEAHFDGLPLSSELVTKRSTAKIMIGKKRHQSKLKEINRAYNSVELIPNTAPDPTIAWKALIFGDESFKYGGPFGIAPTPALRKLIGERVGLVDERSCSPVVEVSSKQVATQGSSIRLVKGGEISAFMEGEILNDCVLPLAFEVGGEVVAVTQSSTAGGKNKRRGRVFTALLPEESIVDGALLQIWGVSDRGFVSAQINNG